MFQSFPEKKWTQLTKKLNSTFWLKQGDQLTKKPRCTQHWWVSRYPFDVQRCKLILAMQGKSSDFAKLNPQVSMDVIITKLNPQESRCYPCQAQPPDSIWYWEFFSSLHIASPQNSLQIKAIHFHDTHTKELFCIFSAMFLLRSYLVLLQCSSQNIWAESKFPKSLDFAKAHPRKILS